MYAPAPVANTHAWIALVNTPNSMIGIGMISGTRETSTPTTNSSARMLPKSRKDRESGFVKSSRTLIGNKNAAGEIYRLK